MDDTYQRRINHQLNVFNKPLLSCNCNKTLTAKQKKMILGCIQFAQS
jgi:hypothetical protein